MRPLVSVIMPVFNCEKYVSAAIESVISQTYAHWELLVVNDGSTDNSEKKIIQYTDVRIRYFKHSNKGVSAARNTALREMLGDYFCFLDADDMLPANSIASRLMVFERSDAIQFADGVVHVYNADLSKLVNAWKPAYTGNPFQQLVRLTGKCFFGPTWMIKKQPLTTYAFREGLHHGEDLLFYIAISSVGEYSYTQDHILSYRKNASSAMHDLDGLAKGYTELGKTIFQKFGEQISFGNKMLFKLKVRKIMFLSFIDKNEYQKALKFLFYGFI